jgi:hypothetical protein
MPNTPRTTRDLVNRDAAFAADLDERKETATMGLASFRMLELLNLFELTRGHRDAVASGRAPTV